MNILITGGTGFIGSRLAVASLQEGDSVRVLGQANTPAESANLERLQSGGIDVILGSVTEPDELSAALGDVEVVYHLAAAQHEAGMPEGHFRRVNVQGTRNMLEASMRAGVRRFVHGSTIGVYRAVKGTTVEDDSPTEPDNIYGVTKLEAERVVRSFEGRIPATIIRISETYGPGDRRLLKLFKAVKKGSYFQIGRSDNLHHPVYVDDLVQALRLAAVAESAVGRTIVVPGYETVTSKEMVTTIADALGVKPAKLTVPLWPLWLAAIAMELTCRPLRLQPPLHRRRMHFFIKSFSFRGDSAREALGYAPSTNFLDGISRTADWYQEQQLL